MLVNTQKNDHVPDFIPDRRDVVDLTRSSQGELLSVSVLSGPPLGGLLLQTGGFNIESDDELLVVDLMVDSPCDFNFSFN